MDAHEAELDAMLSEGRMDEFAREMGTIVDCTCFACGKDFDTEQMEEVTGYAWDGNDPDNCVIQCPNCHAEGTIKDFI